MMAMILFAHRVLYKTVGSRRLVVYRVLTRLGGVECVVKSRLSAIVFRKSKQESIMGVE
jgi:hypothetical protein